MGLCSHDPASSRSFCDASCRGANRWMSRILSTKPLDAHRLHHRIRTEARAEIGQRCGFRAQGTGGTFGAGNIWWGECQIDCQRLKVAVCRHGVKDEGVAHGPMANQEVVVHLDNHQAPLGEPDSCALRKSVSTMAGRPLTEKGILEELSEGGPRKSSLAEARPARVDLVVAPSRSGESRGHKEERRMMILETAGFELTRRDERVVSHMGIKQRAVVVVGGPRLRLGLISARVAEHKVSHLRTSGRCCHWGRQARTTDRHCSKQHGDRSRSHRRSVVGMLSPRPSESASIPPKDETTRPERFSRNSCRATRNCGT